MVRNLSSTPAGPALAPWTWPLLIVLVLATRLPALLHWGPIDDEAVYAVVGKVMLHGGLPYLDAIERKPPLLFGVYWASLRLFGEDNWLALHLLGLAWVLATMRGLELAAARLAGPRAGLIAALAYGLIQPFATAKNLAFNGEVLMNLPLAWAYALVLGRREGPGAAWRALAAGVLIALATLLKQPAAIAALPLGLYLLGTPQRQGWRLAGLAVLGGAATMALTGLWLARHGLLGDAWYWSVLDHTVPHVFWLRAGEHTALFVLCALPLLLPLADRARQGAAWRGREAERRTLLGWTAVSVIGAAAGGRFYPHYYIQVLPPLSVLAGAYYAGRMRHAQQVLPRWSSPAYVLRFTLVMVLASLAVQTVQLRSLNAPAPRALWVRAHAAPGDRLFVWGQATQDYLDAGLLPASRYIATFPLTGYIFGQRLPGVSTQNRIVPGAWDKLEADLAARPPRFVIDTQNAPNADYPVEAFPRIARFLAAHYCPRAALPDGTIHERCK